MKILLHSCCAPCSIECVSSLRAEGHKTELFWYNPNIHPYTEYKSRRDCLAAFAAETGLKLSMNDEYGLRRFLAAVPEIPPEEIAAGGNEIRVSRCAACYLLRLEKTAAFAAANSCPAFSTTLLISPYQNHELIRKTGEACAAKYGVEFLYHDFRPRFREGQKAARERAYYMQKYCGCIFSEEERYLGNQNGTQK